MKKGQRRARRMALYLSSIGIPPVPSAGSYKQWAAVLQAQYNALEVRATKARATDWTAAPQGVGLHCDRSRISRTPSCSTARGGQLSTCRSPNQMQIQRGA